MRPTTLTLNYRDRAVPHAASADRLAQAGLITTAEPVRLTPTAQQLPQAA